MAQHKNALIRYQTIDKCLQNNNRRWSLDDLISACSDALYEFEGRTQNISKRTIQLDIQMMRSEKLGYHAPIEVYDKKYYRYAEEGFTITAIPLTETDVQVLTETVLMLKQFQNFSLFQDVSDIVQRLEDKIYTETTQNQPIIHLDRNEKLKGIHFLDGIYQSIAKKIVLKMKYQSFTSINPSVFDFYPVLLKEYNNRWFVIGKKSTNSPILSLALDRIIELDYDFSKSFFPFPFDPEEYYKYTVGVTVMKGIQPKRIALWVAAPHAPYVLTKPIHRSQRLIQTLEDQSIIIHLLLQMNFEFERILLGFGAGIKVIAPQGLKERIARIHQDAALLYEEESKTN